MDDTRIRLIHAAIRGVREYGLEGVRIVNISELAGLSPGALYRYFSCKEDLIEASFVWVDQQASEYFERLDTDPELLAADPLAAFQRLWSNYFHFWTDHPDMTVFYHRVRDSERYQLHGRRDIHASERYLEMADTFYAAFPGLRELDATTLQLHLLSVTVMYAKCIAEGSLRPGPETEERIFRLLLRGVGPYMGL